MKQWMSRELEFHESETKLGEETFDVTHRIFVRFQRETWTEHHDYGSTTAGQEMYDDLDEGYTLELDAKPTTREALNALYGEEWVDHTITYMEALAHPEN